MQSTPSKIVSTSTGQSDAGVKVRSTKVGGVVRAGRSVKQAHTKAVPVMSKERIALFSGIETSPLFSAKGHVMNTAAELSTQRPSTAKTMLGSSRAITSHAELLADMDAHRREVTATPEAAMAFLKRAGLVTRGGKSKQLIRG